ncbi:hypothetical protein LTS18_007493 [Coniosporium uncinatum]|uniref:Uncharacterized protein n=1 Tax=Coniosporium uncinatum TaxID=93489 RepID=A0ACC3D2H2_9PEZI|nr:hypothetical protein LTS18_007493 [Coniosporium uncinatum]
MEFEKIESEQAARKLIQEVTELKDDLAKLKKDHEETSQKLVNTERQRKDAERQRESSQREAQESKARKERGDKLNAENKRLLKQLQQVKIEKTAVQETSAASQQEVEALQRRLDVLSKINDDLKHDRDGVGATLSQDRERVRKLVEELRHLQIALNRSVSQKVECDLRNESSTRRLREDLVNAQAALATERKHIAQLKELVGTHNYDRPASGDPLTLEQLKKKIANLFEAVGEHREKYKKAEAERDQLKRALSDRGNNQAMRAQQDAVTKETEQTIEDLKREISTLRHLMLPEADTPADPRLLENAAMQASHRRQVDIRPQQAPPNPKHSASPLLDPRLRQRQKTAHSEPKPRPTESGLSQSFQALGTLRQQ